MQAALDILEEQGLAALTLRAAARRAGVSHAAPYHHFADKEAILAAVAARGFRMQSQAMEAAARNAPRPTDGLQAYGLTYATFAQAHPSLFRLMYTREHSIPHATPEVVEASKQIYPNLVEGICQTTGCSQDQAHGIALVLWSTLHGLAMLWLDGQLHGTGATSIDTLAYDVTELLGRILTPPTT